MTDLALDGRSSRTALMSPALAVSDIVGIAERNLLRIARTPQLLFFASVRPVMLVLLFRYVFGGAITVPGLHYVDYLLPGIFVQTALFGGAATSVGLAEDLKGGVIDRFRGVPMARSAVLARRTLADSSRSDAGRTRLPLALAGGPLERRDLRRVRRDRGSAIPQRGVVIASRPRLLSRPAPARRDDRS
jgi:hypothetical protein